MVKKFKEASLKKVYEKCKPGMLKKFGRILSYEEFVEYLAMAHEQKHDDNECSNCEYISCDGVCSRGDCYK